MMLRSFFSHTIRDNRGSMTIETAIVAPVLALMTLGTFETSLIISRQHEIQSAATEVEMIALATNDGAVTNARQLKEIVRESLDLENSDKVQIQTKYRCGTAEQLTNSRENCATSDVVSTYIDLRITDTYTPTWTSFGIGKRIDFEVERTVQIS